MDPVVCDSQDKTASIARFFRAHQAEWRAFVGEFVPVTPQPPLQALAKFFVIRANQPFDMPAYMKAQAQFIQQSLDGRLDSCTPEERQKLVAEWLRANAQSHRDQIILEQARCIDDCAEALLPLLSELLQGVVPSP